MARFSCNDIDGFVLDMAEYAKLPDSTIRSILQSGAEVVRDAHKEAISAQLHRTGKLMGSPQIIMKSSGGHPYALIYPQGTHHTYRAKKGSGSAPNAEIGFVHEFGGHGNPALNWMRTANEKCADAMAEAEERTFDSWLKRHNL